MKTITLGVLFAVVLVSVSGCHWRHRRDRNYHHRSYNSQSNVDQLAINRRAANAERNI
jgi:hypothetical protein